MGGRPQTFILHGMVDLAEAFRAMQRREFALALTALGEPDVGPERCAVPSEWWRMRALILNAAGQLDGAQEAFESGLAVLDRENRTATARLHASYGGFLINQGRWWEAIEAFGHCREAAKQSRDTPAGLSVTYNLAWAHLLTGDVERAAGEAERDILAVGRPSGQSFGALILCARSLVALVRGDAALARSTARLAARLAPTPEVKARALYVGALATMSLGEPEAAREELQASQATYGAGDGGRRAGVLLALWSGRVPDVDTADDQAKVLLYQAAWALRGGDDGAARELLRRGVTTGSAYVAALGSRLLPELREWSAGTPFPLPVWRPPSRVIEVKVRGVLGLTVNGHRVQSRLPVGTASLLAALVEADVGGTAERRALPAARVVREALGGSAGALSRAVHQARMLIGDEEAVQDVRVGAVPWVRLSDRWTWQVDARGHGRVLGGRECPVADLYP